MSMVYLKHLFIVEECVATIDANMTLSIYKLLSLEPLKKEFQLMNYFPFTIEYAVHSLQSSFNIWIVKFSCSLQHRTKVTCCPMDSTLWFFKSIKEYDFEIVQIFNPIVRSFLCNQRTLFRVRVQLYIPHLNVVDEKQQKQKHSGILKWFSSSTTKLDSEQLCKLLSDKNNSLLREWQILSFSLFTKTRRYQFSKRF
jgi:hypothetical protein